MKAFKPVVKPRDTRPMGDVVLDTTYAFWGLSPKNASFGRFYFAIPGGGIATTKPAQVRWN